MSENIQNLIDGTSERLRQLKERPDAIKLLAAAVCVTLAIIFGLALQPRREAGLPAVFTLMSENNVAGLREAVLHDKQVLKQVDLDRNTPLHVAVLGGSTEMVELLLQNGADLTAKNRHGWTPLTATIYASGHQAQVAQLLIDAGASRDETFDGGDTLLHLAASTPEVQPKLIAVLATNADSAVVSNQAGETPIDQAKKYGHTKVLKALQKLQLEAASSR